MIYLRTVGVTSVLAHCTVIHSAHELSKCKCPKNDRLSSNCKKVIKIKLRIICKPYAYLQSIIKTTVKFQKNQNETVGGVVHTRYPLSIHFHCQNDRK